ncbi:hypothetical protein KAW43_00140 [Candidatus Parcubacteria bacterium]|nr:hypothetical protein [Candidatus Parcubacteria bacterium]
MEKKGSYAITIGKIGVMASHLIMINGIFKLEYCEKEEIEYFIKTKTQEIDDSFQAEIEFLKIEMGKKTRIEIQILVALFGSLKTIEEWSREWLKNHIGNNIAHITKLEIKAISPSALLCAYE